MTLGVGRLLPTYNTKVILGEGKLGLGHLKGSNKLVLSVFLVPVSFLDNFPEGIGIRGGEDLCLCECDCNHVRILEGVKHTILAPYYIYCFDFSGPQRTCPQVQDLVGSVTQGVSGLGDIERGWDPKRAELTLAHIRRSCVGSGGKWNMGFFCVEAPCASRARAVA